MAASPSAGPSAAQPATDQRTPGDGPETQPQHAPGDGPETQPRHAAGDSSAARRQHAAVAGHLGDQDTATERSLDPDPSVRASAFGALARLGRWDAAALARALADRDPGVRRRGATIAGRHAAAAAHDDDDADAAAGSPAASGSPDPSVPAAADVACAARARTDDAAAAHAAAGSPATPADRCIPDDTTADLAEQGAALLVATDDADDAVVEAAAWALGELPLAARPTGTVARLSALATGHPDPLCQEAAVAALGAIGDPGGLDAVLHALGGRPPLRRRAAVALAAFDDPRADEALQRCRSDRDWQVREVVEELMGPDPDVLGTPVPEPHDPDRAGTPVPEAADTSPKSEFIPTPGPGHAGAAGPEPGGDASGADWI